MEDILIQFGSEIKSLGNGKIGGYLVRFSTKDKPDLAGDFFTKETDFGFEGSIETPIYLNHRLPLETPDGKSIVVKSKIGKGTLTKDDDGVLIEAILFNRKKYEKALTSLGWSSGTANHLSDREPAGKAFKITTWPLGLDASLTPIPCDPSNVCTLKSFADSIKAAVIAIADTDSDDTDTADPLKSLPVNSLATALTKHIDDRVDEGRDRAAIIKSLAREAGLDMEQVEGILTGSVTASQPNLKAFARVLEVSIDSLKSARQRDYQRTIKGMFEEALADKTPSRWELDSVYCDVVRKIAQTAAASSLTGVEFDADAKVKEAAGEYLARLSQLTIAQINDYVESGSDEPFYLKAIINTISEGLETDHLDLPQHSELVASAETGIMKRFRRFYETRIKAGRVLSEKTRKIIQAVRDNAAQLVSDCDALLEETKPMATDEAMRAAQTRHLTLKTQRRQIGA